MRKLLFTLLSLLCLTAGAQNAEKLYQEGKQLYDEKKYDEAFPKLKTAAEKGHKKAQYRLGRCYDKGHGVTEDDHQAFLWYEKSAAQGFAKAQYQMGKSYKNGEGVEENREKAVYYFTLAAKQENADGELALGKAYMKGKGVAQNQREAKKWLSRAVNNPKGGKEVLDELRKEAAEGDDDAIAILKITGKN